MLKVFLLYAAVTILLCARRFTTERISGTRIFSCRKAWLASNSTLFCLLRNRTSLSLTTTNNVGLLIPRIRALSGMCLYLTDSVTKSTVDLAVYLPVLGCCLPTSVCTQDRVRTFGKRLDSSGLPMKLQMQLAIAVADGRQLVVHGN